MIKLNDEVFYFLNNQGYVIVSTSAVYDPDGSGCGY